MGKFNWINGQAGGTPLSAENLNQMQDNLLKLVFPVGSTYITQKKTNPNSILGFGTWERLKGKVCLGIDEDDTDLNVIGKTGGEKKHKLTIAESPSHIHNYVSAQYYYGEAGDDGNSILGVTNSTAPRFLRQTQTTGGDQPHNNMQPYEVVGYMWIRRN